jgi:hypothetical protein
VAREAIEGAAGEGTHLSCIDLVLVPVDKLGRFKAEAHGGILTKATRQPFFEAARELRAAGVSPETELTASHAGSKIVAMRSTVGAAAKWTIEERDRGGLRKRLWRPFPGTRGAPKTAEDDSDGPLPAPATEGPP